MSVATLATGEIPAGVKMAVVYLRVAKPVDFKDESDLNPKRKLGQVYWIEDKDGEISNKPSYITADTDLNELKYFLGLERVYVPATWNDEKIYQ